MLVKKTHIISTALILGLFTAQMSLADNNNLVQLDLKRTSDNSVDVTLVTSENYGDNVLVRKKSDNKYVILVPKVQSPGFRSSNLVGVSDLVSNLDVKTVNDTSGGYTKVTLITTKPLDIKTKTTKRPVQSSAKEDQEYNTIIAQANAVRNTISTKEPPRIREQKTEVTVNKAPTEKSQPKTEQKSQNITKNTADLNKKPKTEQAKPEIKLKEINPEKIEKQIRKENLNALINEVKSEQTFDNVPPVAPSNPEPAINNEINDITELPSVNTEKTSILSTIGLKIKSGISAVKHRIPSRLPKAAGIMFAALLLASVVIKGLKRTVSAINMQETFVDDIPAIQPESFGSITSHDNNMSWKEKYKMYTDPVSRADNKGNYTFIKSPSKTAISKKRRNLEKLVAEKDYTISNTIEPEIVETEDNSISKTIKFKAFASNRTTSLKMTDRNRIRSRFTKYKVERPLHEQNTVILDDTPLTTNRRSLKDANLKVEDVDSRKIKYEPKEYIMSSVDEYLSLLDDEKAVQTNIPSPVSKTNATNPISKTDKSAYLKGTIVKSGFKIDQDKGLYIVNKNGKNALVGKINDKVFVLKNFDKNITNPIQVRHDNANVYMVKADGFKSLVEVNNDDMGVLIEL